MFCKLASLGVSLVVATSTALAVNPFIRTHYSADPSAHVFDGRLYVYPSHDRNDAKEYDMTDYHVYSTDDLANWQDHGVVLDVKDVAWGKSHMWAPDINKIGETYYFVFCPRPREPFKGRPIGVATGKSPAGPFVPATQPIADCNGIDPSLFIDDDGTPYIFWAGAGCEVAKMKPDLSAFAEPRTKITGTKNFFEGPFVFKREGKYYLTYPAKMKGGSADGGNGQWYDYATADAILGPYTYRGHFTRSDEGAGNVHGSQVEFNGKWYAFNHDIKLSRGDKKAGFKRSIRVEEMTFADDGSINELKWTDEGPPQIKAFDPYKKCEAECLAECDKPEGAHGITTETAADGAVTLGGLNDGDWVRYAGVDFADGALKFDASLASPKGGGTVELRLDALDGPLVASLPILATGDWHTFKTASIGVDRGRASGKHELFLIFRGAGGGGLCNFDWFEFSQK